MSLGTRRVRVAVVFWDHSARPNVGLITWKPWPRTMPLGREYPPSQKGGPLVEVALVVLIVATFAALVVPSFLGVLIDPSKFKERPTPPSLARPMERNRLGLPNWLLMPRLRKGPSSQPQPSPNSPERSAPSLQLARRRKPETSGDVQPSVDKPAVVASLPVRRK
jgi:hypothetical protein